MAIVTPQGIIKLIRGCPLDAGYANTMFFSTKAEQDTYFTNSDNFLEILPLANYSYIRKENVLRVELTPDRLQGFNYMYFYNSGFSDGHGNYKTFYAFIDRVRYVNNTTTEISFTVDVMQTYFFDYTLIPSFVDRQHAETDSFGENTVPENLNTGEFQLSLLSPTLADINPSITYPSSEDADSLFFPSQVCIAATKLPSGIVNRGEIFHNVFSSTSYRFYDCRTSEGLADLKDDVEAFAGSAVADGVISIFQCPLLALSNNVNPVLTISYNTLPASHTFPSISGGTAYTARNTKLLQSPYKQIYVTNNEGSSANFAPELFSSIRSNSRIQFRAFFSVNCDPTGMIIPVSYKGQNLNYNERLTVANYPQCDYNTDLYKAYLAQHSNTIQFNDRQAVVRLASGAISNITHIATGIATAPGNPLAAGQIASGAGGLIGNLVDFQSYHAQKNAALADMELLPPQSKNTQSSTPLVSAGRKGFDFFEATISAEYARKIDSYFDMYGYAQNRIMQPHRKARSLWTYLKMPNAEMRTAKTSLSGMFYVGPNIPADDLETIKAIYRNGITFWTNGRKIGDYSQNNAIISTPEV